MRANMLIDTYPSYLEFWASARDWPLEEQIEGWRSTYLAPWPELLEKQLRDYVSQKMDWRQVARQRVFPFLAQRSVAMRTAHDNLLDLWESSVRRAQEVLGWNSGLALVIHVGIGSGAGWATTFQGWPAVLLGLENIAEEAWQEPAALRGLLAHEVGHLAHFDWRARPGLPEGSGPWWDLYTEGFAQRCESLSAGESWHMTAGDTAWRAWCVEHQTWLAAAFLRAADKGESTRRFFGSWHQVGGHKQTGYYLGHQVVDRLQASLTLQEIALLPDPGQAVRAVLVEMAEAEPACPS